MIGAIYMRFNRTDLRSSSSDYLEFDEIISEKDRIISLQERDMESLKREIVSLKKQLNYSNQKKKY